MDGVTPDLTPADSRAYYISYAFLESCRGQCLSLLGDAADAGKRRVGRLRRSSRPVPAISR